MCELARLPNVICSDTIETVSLSGYTKLCDDSYNLAKTFLSKYKRRTEFLDYSLHQYFHVMKNKNKYQCKEIIPHYVGGSGQPTHPITMNYARIELMKHRPWSSSLDILDHNSIIEEFQNFLKDPKCPLIVKLSFERAKLRYMQQQRGLKEVIDFPQETSNALNDVTDKETLDILAVNNNIAAVTDDFQNCENAGLEIGRDYDWGKRQYKVRSMNQIIFSTFI
jgi:hypothetical protein